MAGKEYWKDFEPQIGDIGEIIFVTKSKYKEIIYILKIKITTFQLNVLIW